MPSMGFGNTPYDNPQMGGNALGFGLTTPQAQAAAPPRSNVSMPGWYNQSSQYEQWENNWAPDEAAWQGQAPGHQGQSYSYNPQTGEAGWINSAGGLQMGGTNPYGNNSGMITWTDPTTGITSINPGALERLFSGLGLGGGSSSYNPYEMTDFQGGQLNVPEEYGGGDWDVAKNVVNVHDVIESYRPEMEANIASGFAQAGNRLGQSGMVMSTPYAQALGTVEQLARDQMNRRGLEYQYDAGKFDAGNQMAAMMGKNAEAFDAWKTHGGWDLGAQGQNLQNAMRQWELENQFGFADNQAANEWDFTNQQMQQDFMGQLLGGILGGL